MIETIVVGTDGSPTAGVAVRDAIALARQLGARLHVVSAYRPLAGVRAGGPDPDRAAHAAGPTLRVDAVLEDAAGAAHASGVDAECYARRGDPADVILDVAEEANASLIVVGSRGMHGTKRFLLGSVPDKISHHAPCSVLIVRTD